MTNFDWNIQLLLLNWLNLVKFLTEFRIAELRKSGESRRDVIVLTTGSQGEQRREVKNLSVDEEQKDEQDRQATPTQDEIVSTTAAVTKLDISPSASSKSESSSPSPKRHRISPKSRFFSKSNKFLVVYCIFCIRAPWGFDYFNWKFPRAVNLRLQ